MLEHFIALMDENCTTQVVAEAQALNLQAEQSAQDIFRIFQNITQGDACVAAYAGYLAYKVDTTTSPYAAATFLSVANRVELSHQKKLAEAMERAWPFIRFDEANAVNYFMFAGIYRLEVPEKVALRFANSPVTEHTDAAFAYHGYRMMVGDKNATATFEKSFEQANQDVDRLFGLISGLIDTGFALKRQGRDVTEIHALLRPYRDDNRRSTGVNGPGTGAAISDIVGSALRIFANH